MKKNILIFIAIPLIFQNSVFSLSQRKCMLRPALYRNEPNWVHDDNPLTKIIRAHKKNRYLRISPPNIFNGIQTKVIGGRLCIEFSLQVIDIMTRHNVHSDKIYAKVIQEEGGKRIWDVMPVPYELSVESTRKQETVKIIWGTSNEFITMLADYFIRQKMLVVFGEESFYELEHTEAHEITWEARHTVVIYCETIIRNMLDSKRKEVSKENVVDKLIIPAYLKHCEIIKNFDRKLKELAFLIINQALGNKETYLYYVKWELPYSIPYIRSLADNAVSIGLTFSGYPLYQSDTIHILSNIAKEVMSIAEEQGYRRVSEIQEGLTPEDWIAIQVIKPVGIIEKGKSDI